MSAAELQTWPMLADVGRSWPILAAASWIKLAVLAAPKPFDKPMSGTGCVGATVGGNG